MGEVIRDLIYFLRDWFRLDNALNALFWTILTVGAAYGLGKTINLLADARFRRRVIQPDAEGRYPVFLLKNRNGVAFYDRERGWGITSLKQTPRGDVEVSVAATPEQLLEHARDIELARAAARKLVPVNYSDARNIHAPQEQYSYAPSNVSERTNVGDQTPEEVSEDSIRPELPKVIDFFENLEQREAGHIIMGMGEDGSLIQIPLTQVFHHLVGGMSGWGKSVYLRGFVYQLMQEADTTNIQIGLADIENNTFPEFKDKLHIRWFASNAIEIEQMTSHMLKEIERRKNLYESMKGGTPKDIERYNILARRELKEELPIIVLLYDEFSAFMHNRAQAAQKRILADILQLALRARKYGIFLVLGGQSFKADLVDTSVIGQFAFNISFRVRTVQTSLSILGTGGAESLTQAGEALMKQKDGQIVRVQALYVDDDTLIEELMKYEQEEHSSIVPDIVREIITFSRERLGGKLLIRELEVHLRDLGSSRKDLMIALEWMEMNKFITRGEKNARVLNEEQIKTILPE